MTTVGFGVLNAPVEERCSCSYSSWSSLGRRGGAGPEANGEAARRWGPDEKRRRVSWDRKARGRVDCISFCFKSSGGKIGTESRTNCNENGGKTMKNTHI